MVATRCLNDGRHGSENGATPPVFDRERLAVGARIGGPAIVEEAGGTTVIPPGWTIEVDGNGALTCEGGMRW